MSPDAPRKWLPSEAYRVLVLRALVARGDAPATKNELAKEVRANHYMISHVLAALHQAGHIAVQETREGYRIRASEAGAAFLDAHWESTLRLFETTLRRHFAFGRAPDWVPFR